VAYDVAAVRAQYPALADGRAWLDGAAGTQVPAAVIEAMSGVLAAGVANQGARFAASHRAGEIVAQARAAVADLVGAADPRGVVFGPSMTALTYRFAAALSARWGPGDEIVLTQLDHDANIRPWAQAAAAAGVLVRMAQLDPAAGMLPADAVTGLITDATRLVAVTAASNLLGAIPDVPAIAAAARAAGALSYVDGVHHCPHARVDLTALGADLYVTSAYKWAGPHLAAVVAADPAVLADVPAANLAPAPDTVPERFELGTKPFEALAGVTAAVDHLATLDGAASGDRRARLLRSRASAVGHEQRLCAVLVDGLRSTPGVRLLGPGPQEARTPVAAFLVDGCAPVDAVVALDGEGINAWHGHSYAWEAASALGIREAGGAVRLSVNHYNDESDVERALSAVAALVRERS
jgi:cysteine desulfurase family protein (TIGR01976 family)